MSSTAKAEVSHTPGPWYATGIHVQSASINEDNYVCGAEGNNQEQAEANAKLIASAPAMFDEIKRLREVNAALLEALKIARNVMGDFGYNDTPNYPMFQNICNVIALAEKYRGL